MTWLHAAARRLSRLSGFKIILPWQLFSSAELTLQCLLWKTCSKYFFAFAALKLKANCRSFTAAFVKDWEVFTHTRSGLFWCLLSNRKNEFTLFWSLLWSLRFRTDSFSSLFCATDRIGGALGASTHFSLWKCKGDKSARGQQEFQGFVCSLFSFLNICGWLP